MTRGKNMLAT